jgi:hypothetical protein
MIPILMHQMRILTSQVSSVMLKSKNFVFGSSSWSVNTNTNCGINAQFVNTCNTQIIMDLAYKDYVVTSFVG